MIFQMNTDEVLMFCYVSCKSTHFKSVLYLQLVTIGVVKAYRDTVVILCYLSIQCLQIPHSPQAQICLRCPEGVSNSNVQLKFVSLQSHE